MSNSNIVAGYLAPSRFALAFKTFAAEVSVVSEALLSPGKLIAEVEQIRKLQNEADRIEANDPTRAGVLRRRASRICLS